MADNTVLLNTGTSIPLVGFGTWQLRGAQCRRAVGWALEAGYRHLDTATMYDNEREVGTALRESGLPRDEVFLTTKLPPDRADRVRTTLQESLDALGTDHVDLWLIHWPPGGPGIEVWREFITAYDEGLARAIGVSNYHPGQLDELIDATGVTPAVNQVKWSPALFDRARLAHSRERGVVLEGYSPFKASDLDDPLLQRLGEKYDLTPAQVVVRWHVEHEVVVIPKSAQRERIEANIAVFTAAFEAEDVAALDALGQ